MFSVLIVPAAQRQFIALPLKIQMRLADVFKRLVKWPDVSGCKALKGNRKGQFRLRSGDYRILFTVDVVPKIISVVKVGNRKDVYED